MFHLKSLNHAVENSKAVQTCMLVTYRKKELYGFIYFDTVDSYTYLSHQNYWAKS